MKSREFNFRNFYQKYIVIAVKDHFKASVKHFPGGEDAKYILTYGYIDHTAGLTLEILATAQKIDDGFLFGEGNKEISLKIRIGSIKEDEYFSLEDEDGSLYERYADKLEMLEKYYSVCESVKESRKMTFLDHLRNTEYPDDVLVYLLKDGNQIEGCWVRIESLVGEQFIGTLLNEPNQDFAYHEGEEIAFAIHQTEDEEIILFSNMNTKSNLAKEDLETTTMLETAIHIFNEEATDEHLVDIIKILRDSHVWIPCTIVNDKDEPVLSSMLDEKEDTSLIPSILQNGESFFLPIFSTEEAMGEYGEGFTIIEKHFLEVLNLAINNEIELEGIVINALSEPFIIYREMWDIFSKMDSSIEK